MASLADLMVHIGTDVSDLDEGLRSSSEKVAEFGKSMQTAGLKMTALATAPIVAGFAKAADKAGDLNESVNAVNVVFGEGADKIEEFGKVAATEAGLSARAFNELVTPVGASLQNVGFGADEAAEASVNLAKRAADMASVFNVDVSEALGAIQSGLRGEADPLEKFGVGLSDAAVTAHALEMGLADTASELDDNAKTQARLSLLMEQTDRVAGDFAATSGEAANAQRIMAAQAENTAAQFGQKLLPMKAKAIELASGLLDKFDSMSPTMQTAAIATLGVVAAIGPLLLVTGTLVRSVGEVGKAFSAAASAAPKMASAASTVASASGRAVTALGQWIAAGARWVAQTVAQSARAVASMAVTAAQFIAHYTRMAARAMANAVRMAASWVVAMGPVAWVIAGIVALVALIIANWDKVKEWTKKIWTWLGEKVAAVWTSIKDTTTRAVDAVVGFFTGLRDRAVDKVTGLYNRVTGFFGDLRDRVVGIATGIRDRVVEFFTGLKDGAIEKVEALVDRVSDIKDEVLGFFSNAGSWLWDAGKNIVQGLIDGIGNMIGAVGRKMNEVVTSITNRLPWSPAKTGPLRKNPPGKGGANIIQQLVDGMGGEVGTLAAMADRAAAAAMPNLGAASVGGVQVPSVSSRRFAGEGAAGGVSITVNAPNYVGNERDLIEAVHTGLVQKLRRNISLGLTR